MQEKSGGEASEPPDKKNGITNHTSDPSQLSLSFERSVREKTKENTPTPSLALYVDEKTTQKHNPQDPPSSLLREDVTEVQAPKTPCLLEGDNPEKISFLPAKTAPAKIFSKEKTLFSPSLGEEKGANVSTKKILTEVEKVSSKTPLVPHTTTTTVTSGSLTKNPAPVSDKGEKKINFGYSLEESAARIVEIEREVGEKKSKAFLQKGHGTGGSSHPVLAPQKNLKNSLNFHPSQKRGQGIGPSPSTFISPEQARLVQGKIKDIEKVPPRRNQGPVDMDLSQDSPVFTPLEKAQIVRNVFLINQTKDEKEKGVLPSTPSHVQKGSEDSSLEVSVSVQE